MADLVKFVDSIADSPTVRLDLNGEATNGWYCRTFSAPAPRLRRSVSANAMRDGINVGSSSYDARTLVLELECLKNDQDSAATELQKLARELDRDGNFLMYQPQGATKPVFFKTFRSDLAQIDDVIAQKAMRRFTIELLAEPFALGLRETLGPFTVNNDPAADSNGHFVDISGVLGDVDTLCLIRDAGTHTPGGYLATRQHGTPSNGIWNVQQEATGSGSAGTDTTNPGGGPDAAMSGSGSNFLRTSFATDASMVTRWTSSLGGTNERNGTYRILAVVRRSDATSVIKARLVTTCRGVVSTGTTVTVPASTARQVVDLGVFDLGADQQEGQYGSALNAITVQTDLQAQRVSGTGTIDWDYIYLLPADEGTLIFRRRSTVSGSIVLVLDGPNAVINCRAAALQTQIVSDDFDAAGGFLQLKPGIAQRVFYIVTDLFASPFAIDKTVTSSLSFEYWPRYLYVRPSAS